MVHDVHPTVFRGENEESHESIEDVVKVVFLVGPLVARILETVSFICDVLTRHCCPVTIEEKSFEQLKEKVFYCYFVISPLKHLNSEYAEYKEECTADDDNVADWSQRGQKSLHYQLQSGGSIYYSQRSQGPDDTKYSEYLEDIPLTGVFPNKCGDHTVDEGDDHQNPVQSVPVVREIVAPTHHEACRHRLHDHLYCEDQGEDVVRDVQQFPLSGPGGDSWALHGQSDAISSDENQDDEVKPILGGESLANLPGFGVLVKNIQRVGLSLDEIFSDFFLEGLLSEVRAGVTLPPRHDFLHKTFLAFLLLNRGNLLFAVQGGITATIGWFPTLDSCAACSPVQT